MRLLNRLLNWGSSAPDYSAPQELRAIWDRYSAEWPDNNERYEWWKPAPVLPAPKWVVKRAMKQCYAEWPEPIDWTVFSVFFTEFVDLALHLPQEEYDAVQSFRKARIICFGKEDKHDALVTCRPCSSTAAVGLPIEDSDYAIVHIRDELRRSQAWDPVDVNDYELDNVRQILLRCTAEFHTMTQEWRFYVLSIGRDQYVADT